MVFSWRRRLEPEINLIVNKCPTNRQSRIVKDTYLLFLFLNLGSIWDAVLFMGNSLGSVDMDSVCGGSILFGWLFSLSAVASGKLNNGKRLISGTSLKVDLQADERIQ